MLDVDKLLKLKKDYEDLLEKRSIIFSKAGDKDLPWEDVRKYCREAYSMDADVEAAEYKYKQYIASLNPEDLDILDDKSYESILWIIFLDCPEFQKKAFIRYLDKRKESTKENNT